MPPEEASDPDSVELPGPIPEEDDPSDSDGPASPPVLPEGSSASDNEPDDGGAAVPDVAVAPVNEPTELEAVVRGWCLEQMGHNCSNLVANAFFKFAWDNAPMLYRLQTEMEKMPLMQNLRRKVLSDHLPPIKMDFVFVDRATGLDVDVYNLDAFPRARYPAALFDLKYQMTRVEVTFI